MAKYSQAMTDKICELIVKHKGLISYAINESKISFRTHRNWYNEHEEYKQAIDEAMEEATKTTGDKVESILMELIEIEHNPTATIFYCKTKLKDRGYTEKVEQQISGDIDIKCNFNED